MRGYNDLQYNHLSLDVSPQFLKLSQVDLAMMEKHSQGIDAKKTSFTHLPLPEYTHSFSFHLKILIHIDSWQESS